MIHEPTKRTKTEIEEDLVAARGQLWVARADERDWSTREKAQLSRIAEAEEKLLVIYKARDTAPERVTKLTAKVARLEEELARVEGERKVEREKSSKVRERLSNAGIRALENGRKERGILMLRALAGGKSVDEVEREFRDLL